MNAEAMQGLLADGNVILVIIYCIGLMVGFVWYGLSDRFGYGISADWYVSPIPEFGMLLWPIVFPFYASFKLGCGIRHRWGKWW